MRVAALVHFYVPFRNAGSETMLHTLMRSLRDSGHDARAFVTDTPEAPFVYDYEGIRVTSTNLWTAPQYAARFNPDVIISHHQNAQKAIRLGRKHNVPVVFLMHNDFDLNHEVLANHPDMVVFNTDWISASTNYAGRSIVVHPPVYADEHRAVPGQKVTLVNLNEHKGALLFYRLAEQMPDTQFLGVVGGHGTQIVRNDLPNVEIQEHTDDMPGDVWSKTRTLLMPSIYESYGMAGVEAMASGIPVLAHPTPGLKESLGEAGIFLDRDYIGLWKRALVNLADPIAWRAASKLAKKRSNELDPAAEMREWVRQIEELVNERSA